MDILSSFSSVNSVKQLHQLDVFEMFGKKTGWELHKNVAFNSIYQ